jgi:hypothetical protein
LSNGTDVEETEPPTEALPERRGQVLEHELASSTPDHIVALALITAAVSICGMASTVLLALVGR